MSCSNLNQLNGDGVSETIAGVLLIGLTVVGVALISVFFFSQPVAEEVPAVDVMVSNVSSTILFQHNGGDSLSKEDFTIYVEGNAVDSSALTIVSPGDWPWSVGETISYTAAEAITSLNENVRIAYREEQGAFLRPSFVDDAGINTDLADVASAPLPTLSSGVGPSTVSPEVAGEIVAESILDDSHIVAAFSSLVQDAILEDRYFNFTIVSSNSTINIEQEPGVRNLNTGDQIVIRTGKQQAAGNRISISGVGKTFFNLRFEKVNVWINGVQIENNPNNEVEILNAWIPEYEDLESNLAFLLKEPYDLYIDGEIDYGSGDVTLENVRPTESGMFVVNAWSPKDNENSVILADVDIA